MEVTMPQLKRGEFESHRQRLLKQTPKKVYVFSHGLGLLTEDVQAILITHEENCNRTFSIATYPDSYNLI